jgi:hypothetical protein
MPYVSKPKASLFKDDYWWSCGPDQNTIIEDDESYPTGVLDAGGNEIWFAPDKIKMGFV